MTRVLSSLSILVGGSVQLQCNYDRNRDIGLHDTTKTQVATRNRIPGFSSPSTRLCNHLRPLVSQFRAVGATDWRSIVSRDFFPDTNRLLFSKKRAKELSSLGEPENPTQHTLQQHIRVKQSLRRPRHGLGGSNNWFVWKLLTPSDELEGRPPSDSDANLPAMSNCHKLSCSATTTSELVNPYESRVPLPSQLAFLRSWIDGAVVAMAPLRTDSLRHPVYAGFYRWLLHPLLAARHSNHASCSSHLLDGKTQSHTISARLGRNNDDLQLQSENATVALGGTSHDRIAFIYPGAQTDWKFESPVPPMTGSTATSSDDELKPRVSQSRSGNTVVSTPSPEEQPKAVFRSNSVSDEDLLQFPFTLPQGVTVRYFKRRQSSLLELLASGMILFGYLAVWIISVALPIMSLTWGTSQILMALKFRRGDSNFRTPGEEFLTLFFSNFIKLCRRIRFVTTATAPPLEMGAGYQAAWVEFVTLSWEAVQRLGIIGTTSLLYATAVASTNLADFFWRPQPPPKYPRTSDTSPPLRWWQRLHNAIIRCSSAWYLPGTAVIFENYRSFISCGYGNERPLLLCYHPHGIPALGILLLSPLHEIDRFYAMGAPVLKTLCPLFRICFGSHFLALGSARRSEFIETMKAQANIALIPGGLQEAALTKYGREQLFLLSRKGFIRYSLQHGYSIVPAYCFGENLSYKQVTNRWNNLRFKLNAWGIPTVWPIGSPYTPLGLLPRRVPMLMVIGTPRKLPLISNPTPEEVDKYHALYIQDLSRLYATYADSYYKFCQEKYNIGIPPLTPQEKVSQSKQKFKFAPPLEIC